MQCVLSTRPGQAYVKLKWGLDLPTPKRLLLQGHDGQAVAHVLPDPPVSNTLLLLLDLTEPADGFLQVAARSADQRPLSGRMRGTRPDIRVVIGTTPGPVIVTALYPEIDEARHVRGHDFWYCKPALAPPMLPSQPIVGTARAFPNSAGDWARSEH